MPARFGQITGYLWHQSAAVTVSFDVHGTAIAVSDEGFVPPSGGLTIGNKQVRISPDRTLVINPYGLDE